MTQANEPVLPIGVAILSWKAPHTIRNTLINYQKHDFFSLFEDVVICFQEISKEDKALAEEFGIRCTGTPQNTGILGGFRFACDSLDSKYVMVLGNDCLLREDNSRAKNRLSEALMLLNQGSANLFRMRSRYYPGHQWRAASVYSRFFPIRECAKEWADAETLSTSPNWIRHLRRCIRPSRHASGSADQCMWKKTLKSSILSISKKSATISS